MNGKDIQNLLKKRRLYQWEVAQEIGINEFTLSRWLRNDIDDDKRNTNQRSIRKHRRRKGNTQKSVVGKNGTKAHHALRFCIVLPAHHRLG